MRWPRSNRIAVALRLSSIRWTRPFSIQTLLSRPSRYRARATPLTMFQDFPDRSTSRSLAVKSVSLASDDTDTARTVPAMVTGSSSGPVVDTKRSGRDSEVGLIEDAGQVGLLVRGGRAAQGPPRDRNGSPGSETKVSLPSGEDSFGTAGRFENGLRPLLWD